jgi:hypothetical protein
MRLFGDCQPSRIQLDALANGRPWPIGCRVSSGFDPLLIELGYGNTFWSTSIKPPVNRPEIRAEQGVLAVMR